MPDFVRAAPPDPMPSFGVDGARTPIPTRPAQTRRALLAAAATTNALMLGTHFTGTAAGRILSTDQGYHFAPQPHD